MNARHWIIAGRGWLERNKVFFETLAAVALAFMAIVVALKSNQITQTQTEVMKQQTELMRNQSEIMRIENLPRLHAQLEFRYNDDITRLVHDRLIISNIGSPLEEFSVTDKVFLEVEYGEKESGEMIKVLVPVNSYYGVTVPTKMPTGEQATLFNGDILEGNWNRLSEIRRDFLDLAKKQDAYGSVQIRRYIRLGYKDVFGTNHTDFYLVNNSQTLRIDEEEGDRIFAEFDTRYTSTGFQQFSEISAKDLYEKWMLFKDEREK